VDDVVVVVNDTNAAQFAAWAQRWALPADRFVSDGSHSNADRTGAIACLALALRRHHALIGDRDVLVVAGACVYVCVYVCVCVCVCIRGCTPWVVTTDDGRAGQGTRSCTTAFTFRPF
jgi:hypothetical protein